MSIHHILRIDRANKSFPIAMIAAWALLSSTLQGQEALIISLHSVEDRISKQNPDLAAARKRIDEAAGRLSQSGRMSNPVLGLETSQDPDFLEYSYSVSIAQKFPVTNRLALAKTFSEKSLRAAEAEVRDIERRLCSSAKELVIRILAIEKQRELLSQQKSLADDFASHLDESAQKGEGSVLDAGQAKIKAAQLANELHQLEARAATLHGELKPL
ncbi:MAG: TolC family protein, partial [Akkermansiaceae bacterium]